jgi:hypothetical protein
MSLVFELLCQTRPMKLGRFFYLLKRFNFFVEILRGGFVDKSDKEYWVLYINFICHILNSF